MKLKEARNKIAASFQIDMPPRILLTGFIFVGVLSFLTKSALVTYLFNSAGSVYEIGFGFGGFIRSLHEHFSFVSCDTTCDYATRMPFFPFAIAALSFVSIDYITVAILKNALMSILTILSFWYLITNFSSSKYRPQIWLLVLLILAVSPPAAKHAAMIEYEEGVLTEFVAIWAAALYLLPPIGTYRQPHKIRVMSILLIGIATVIYMTKSSMVLIFSLSLIYVFKIIIDSRDKWLIATIIIALGVVLGWGGVIT